MLPAELTLTWWGLGCGRGRGCRRGCKGSFKSRQLAQNGGADRPTGQNGLGMVHAKRMRQLEQLQRPALLLPLPRCCSKGRKAANQHRTEGRPADLTRQAGECSCQAPTAIGTAPPFPRKVFVIKWIFPVKTISESRQNSCQQFPVKKTLSQSQHPQNVKLCALSLCRGSLVVSAGVFGGRDRGSNPGQCGMSLLQASFLPGTSTFCWIHE
jgi:hypothetical protein